jgi:RimK family alpha-L-glutamate ligase
VQFAVVAHRCSEANEALASAGGGAVLTPKEALLRLTPGDVALNRLDIKQTLDGVESGIEDVDRLMARGVRVLNPPRALLAAHDKLLTSRALRSVALPHPRTLLVTADAPPPRGEFPLVLKPRFGSWGRDVTLCRDEHGLAETIEQFVFTSWFRETGAVMQDYVPTLGWDLRVIVAAGRVVGAARRTAAPGEWRTNVALGGASAPVDPPPRACRLALAAAAAIGADLLGVDMLPAAHGTWWIIELNGAVDFRASYGRTSSPRPSTRCCPSPPPPRAHLSPDRRARDDARGQASERGRERWESRRPQRPRCGCSSARRRVSCERQARSTSWSTT